MGDYDDDELEATRRLYTGNLEEKSVKILVEFCKKTKCRECIYHYADGVCGLHNPSTWRGINNNE